MKRIVLAVVALSVFASFAGSYKWTGAVSSDFADAGNWLVQSGDEWVATETPPANEYGVDTVVFDGDAETCPNQPVISTDYTIRDLKFLTSGWTISGEGSLRLNHCFGGNDYWVNGVQRSNITYAVIDSSGDGTNTISVAFHVTFGYTYNISGGGVLSVLGQIMCDQGPGGNLGSGAKHSLKIGDGTLTIAGIGAASKLSEAYMSVTAGTLELGRTSDGATGVAALSGPLHIGGTGKVVFLADNQIVDTGNGKKKDNLFLSDDGRVDFAGHSQKFSIIECGANMSEAMDWTGEILNSGNVSIGTSNSGSSSWGHFTVNADVSTPVILESGLTTQCGRYNGTGGNALWFYVADNPDLDAELILEGSVFPNRTGNLGVPVHFIGSTTSGGSFGAIVLGCVNGSSGQYARVFVETTVFVNANTDGTSSLGEPRELTVTKTGVLRGDGIVSINTARNSNPVFDVYGALAPGTITNRTGTLALTRGQTNVQLPVTMHTNSVLRIEADTKGVCPKVVQATGTFALQTAESVRAALVAQNAAIEEANAALEEGETPAALIDIEAAMVGVASPKIVMAGANAPARGRHRVLSVTGTLSGAFAPDVELTGFPHADSYSAKILYTTEGGVTHVDVRVDKPGLAIVVR